MAEVQNMERKKINEVNKCDGCYHLDICYGDNHIPMCETSDREKYLPFKDIENDWEVE